MSKDYTSHFSALNTSGIPVVNPNTVSNNIKTGERSFLGVASESGKPILDSEINLHGSLATDIQRTLFLQNNPSGFVLGSKRNAFQDYLFEDFGELTPPSGDFPDNVNGSIIINGFLLSKQEAWVAGYPVTLDFTNIDEEGYNFIILPEPTPYDGTSNTLKRTDFVFLECWKSLVAPDLYAKARIHIQDASDVNAGEVLTIDGVDFTAVSSGAGAFEFEVSPDASTLASNIINAINADSSVVTATSTGAYINVCATTPGTGGNSIAISTDAPGLSVPATLSGGVDRPNKPASGFIYRHGNTQSLEGSWLSDDLMDSTLKSESSQRIQFQYRIRVASDIDFTSHPDGFSNTSSRSYAQGGREVEVYNGNSEGDTRTYPFVRANMASTWDDSDSDAYGREDSGLWIAGDGSAQSAQDLNTLDGFVYAIPICMVFRHNDAYNGSVQGFDPLNNTNGAPVFDHPGYTGVVATVPANASDHPAQEFCDIIKSHLVLDLRNHLLPASLDLQNEAMFQIQSLMDNQARGWAIDMADKETLGGGSGELSTLPLACVEIGRTDAQGGVSPSSGDTGRGECIRNFDHIARRFASHPVVERVVFSFYPGDRPDVAAQGGVAGPGTVNTGKYVVKATSGPLVKDADGWYEEDVLHLDLNEFDSSTLGCVFQGLDDGGTSTALSTSFAVLAPEGTCITDVLGIWHDDGHSTNAVNQEVAVRYVKGIGSLHLEIGLDANDLVVNGGDSGNSDYRMVGSDDATGAVVDDGSPRRIFVEVEITYPAGSGPSNTVWEEIHPDSSIYDGSSYTGNGPVIQNEPAQRPTDYETLNPPLFRQGYREVCIDYMANETLSVLDPTATNTPIGTVSPETLVSRNRTEIYFPRRIADNTVTVEDAVASTSMVLDRVASGSSSRQVVTASNLSGTGQTLCNVTYFAQDPIPCFGSEGYQISIYYRTVAPQTVGVKAGSVDTGNGGLIPTVLRLQPISWPQAVWTSAIGAGSLDRGFPYLLPTEAIPLYAPVGEWYLSGSSTISLEGYETNTGLLHLPVMVPADLQDSIVMGGNDVSQRPTVDFEFRSLYPYTDTEEYQPVVLSQPLYESSIHKNWTAFLARVTQEEINEDDVALFRKGEIVLVVFSRLSNMDSSTDVKITSSDNTGCIAVYRTRNNLRGV